MSSFVVGLTGGIASGKSTVAQYFELCGMRVIDADNAAREAVAIGSKVLAEIVKVFGKGVLNPAGELDRAAMRQRIFSDPTSRQRLEAIVHPRVRDALKAACEAASEPYVVVAIPLLAEGGGRKSYPWLDRVLLIDVPIEMQHARLLMRDSVDLALATSMIASQATRQQRIAIADDVLVNDTNREALSEHVIALDKRYRLLAAPV